MDPNDPKRMLEGGDLRVNVGYDCGVSGHIMGKWMHKKGVGPGGPPTEYRNCVVPGCRTGHQVRTCLIAPTG